MKNSKLTIKQQEDNTLGFVTVTRPMESKLVGTEFEDLGRKFTELISSKRGFDSYGCKTNDEGKLANEDLFHSTHSSLQRSKLELIEAIMQIKL